MPSRKVTKRYPIHQSPLFRIRGKKQFERILGVEWQHSHKLLSEENYRVWLNDKQREIQQPIKWLSSVHKKIANFLSRIELPDYVYSQKGRSYVDNARVHVADVPLVKTDIHKFFPSTSRQMVFRSFLEDFKCSRDIAHRLADICCYRQLHLPTGSPLSGRLSFFVAKKMFDEIAEYTAEAGCKMTLYVDDVTVSGKSATKELLGNVRKIIHGHGYKTKERKSDTYSATAPKPVTGTIVASEGVRLPNERHLKIHQLRRDLRTAAPEDKIGMQKSLRGRLQEASQIVKKK